MFDKLIILAIISYSIAFQLNNFLNYGNIESLHEKLRNYEVIKISRRLEKRGANLSPFGYNRQEHVTFRAFNHRFDLYLTPKKAILHPNFSARTVNAFGHEGRFYVDPEEHFEGHVHGEKHSRVSVTFDEFGAMLGAIRVNGEIYIFEPVRFYDNEREANEVLVYRDSDMRSKFTTNGLKFCKAIQFNSSFDSVSSVFKRHKRSEQSLFSKNRCSLRLVADYRFFQSVGNGSLAFSARYLINVIDRVNVLYTSTEWGQDDDGRRLINMGFMIKDMLIHNESTYGPIEHYNAATNMKRNVNKLLEDFSHRQGSNEYCLVHLFTAQAFEDGVLGLGYISSPEIHSPGGICSIMSRSSNDKIVFYNTALSSVKTMHGGSVVTREADIVTAHELGHNWGATHDDESLECSPPYSEGGSYIMNTYSVSGYDDNNDRFSPCSKRMIAKVLSRKAERCFEEEKGAFCGNNKIENDSYGSYEECDVGGRLSGIDDKCCTWDCRLKPKAKCSPKNFPCCSEDCQFLPNTSLCLHENPLQCKLSSYCTGTSGECPEPKSIADGTRCLEDGECLNGQCLTFCERPSLNMKPCICHNEADSCLRCCRSENGTCQPYDYDPKYILKDGTRCIHGYCRNAICVKEVADVISHFWNIIDNIDETNFWKFVEDNLVGIITIVTLIFWIPVSVFIHHIDKKRLKKIEEFINNRIEVVPEPISDNINYLAINPPS